MTQLLPSVFVSLASALWWRVISTYILSSIFILLIQFTILKFSFLLVDTISWSWSSLGLLFILLIWQGISIIIRAIAIGGKLLIIYMYSVQYTNIV